MSLESLSFSGNTDILIPHLLAKILSQNSFPNSLGYLTSLLIDIYFTLSTNTICYVPQSESILLTSAYVSFLLHAVNERTEHIRILITSAQEAENAIPDQLRLLVKI